jgi:hypothetical protein
VPELAFTNQTDRLRRIVSNALDGTTYQTSYIEEQERRHLVIEARRADGRLVNVRFRAVKDSVATADVPAGAPLRLNSVAAGGGCLVPSRFFPHLFPNVPAGSARVRIRAGDVRLDIVCEDAEWFEDEAPP